MMHKRLLALLYIILSSTLWVNQATADCAHCSEDICRDGVQTVLEGTVISLNSSSSAVIRLDKISGQAHDSWAVGETTTITGQIANPAVGDRVLIYGQEGVLGKVWKIDGAGLVGCAGGYPFSLPASALTEGILADKCRETLYEHGYDDEASMDACPGMCSVTAGKSSADTLLPTLLVVLLTCTRRGGPGQEHA